jgi:hypothetical protein
MIGLKYTESGGVDMDKQESRIAQMQTLANPQIKKGLDMFEKHIAPIKWLHPKETNTRSDKKYIVLNEEGETVYRAEKLADIAKEFDTKTGKVSECVRRPKLLKGRYVVMRCDNE